MKPIKISTDLDDTFTIDQIDKVWVLDDNVTITSVLNGIVNPGGMGDTGIVVKGDILGTSNVGYGIGVIGGRTLVHITDTGSVSNPLGIYATSTANDTVIYNDGSIYASVSGIELELPGIYMENTGTIVGGDYGIHMTTVETDSIATLYNSGTIRADVGLDFMVADADIYLTRKSRIIATDVAIQTSGSLGETLSVINSGLIMAGSGLAIEATDGDDEIGNRGKIIGDIELGEGNDFFVNIKGTLVGDVYGGDGDDRYVIDRSDITIIEFDGQGADEIFSSASYTLAGDFIEMLRLVGKANANATGAGGDEFLIGNRGNNTISGMAGADFIAGNGGNDILTGGDDADTFAFSAKYGHDRITDFVHGEDVINLSGLTMIKDYIDLAAHHMFEKSDGVLIKAGDDRLFIEGATLLTLDENDFSWA